MSGCLVCLCVWDGDLVVVDAGAWVTMTTISFLRTLLVCVWRVMPLMTRKPNILSLFGCRFSTWWAVALVYSRSVLACRWRAGPQAFWRLPSVTVDVLDMKPRLTACCSSCHALMLSRANVASVTANRTLPVVGLRLFLVAFNDSSPSAHFTHACRHILHKRCTWFLSSQSSVVAGVVTAVNVSRHRCTPVGYVFTSAKSRHVFTCFLSPLFN